MYDKSLFHTMVVTEIASLLLKGILVIEYNILNPGDHLRYPVVTSLFQTQSVSITVGVFTKHYIWISLTFPS